jgi:hypothetical protein
MTQDNEDKRTTEDRRESTDEMSEKFIKYFIPEEKEKRTGKDRRKSDSEDLK